jgi:hypothetical protein
MQDKTPKTLRYIAYLSLVITSVVLFVILFWLCYPYNPIEFKNERFIVDTPIVEQGGYLSYTIEYCKDNDLIPVVSTSYVDGIIYQTPNTPQPFYGNDCEPKNFLVYIPKALPPGKYYLDHMFTFKVNPIREVSVEAKTEMFEVIEN